MPLILAFILASAWAGTISVKGNRHYKLDYDKTKIEISSPVINLKFSRMPCSDSIFENFLKKVSRLENDKGLLRAGYRADHFNFTLNGKEFSEPRTSPKAKFIDSLPEELKRMKIEEKLRCTLGKGPKKIKNP